MTRSDSIGAIATALAKAQGEIEGASKDSRNPHFGSKYADLASVVGACREALAKHEIAVVQSPYVFDGNLVRMRTLLLHASGEWIESDELQVQSRDAAPQAIGSCLTYLRRYQLAAMVGVAPEDDDAEAAEGRTTTMAKIAPRVPTPPAKAEAMRRALSVPASEIRRGPSSPEPPPIDDKDLAF